MYPQKSEIADADAGAGFGREKTVGAAATKSEIGEDHKHGDVVAVGEHGEHGEHGGDGEHGERPLFPYPTAKENLQSAMRFFRRFFFILLIIPAWVVPNILTARAKAEMENSHGGGGEGTGHDVPTSSHAVLEYAGLPYATLATLQDGGFVLAGGAGGHGPELSLGANWAIFLLNMFVMMHLGKMANEALEELIPKLGSEVVSIIDAMTSSTVELAVAAFALRGGLIVMVQAAMLGAILNNLLLIMGVAIVVGGIFNRKQELKQETAQTSINILMITCIAYVIPIGLEATLGEFHRSTRPKETDPIKLSLMNQEIRKIVDKDILTLSKIMAFILLGLYIACLFYQYRHKEFMITPSAKYEGQHHRHIHFWFAGTGFVVVMAAQIYSAYLLVHAVEGIGRLLHLNDSFVGFILVPIVLVADLQEEIVAIRDAKNNCIDKTLALMIGSCMQIALLVTPLLVLMGWMMDVPMTFKFTILEVVVLASSVLLANYLISDSETNWLEGVMLVAVFLMCAIAFYYDDSHLSVPPGEGSTIGGGGNPGGH